MWVFTDAADWYDKQRDLNDKFLANAMDRASYDLVGAAVWTSAGFARVLRTGFGAVGGGFVDVIRFGDGMKEGGWGFGKDALRILAVAGPVLRASRYGLSLVAAVDELPTVGNCTWVQGIRALRMTTTRHWATISLLAKEAGITTAETGGLWSVQLVKYINLLGGDAKALAGVTSFDEVAQIARNNSDGVVMFTVRFMRAAKGPLPMSPTIENPALHTLLAKSVGGSVVIVDRSGKMYRTLAALDEVYGASKGLGFTIEYGAGLVLVKNARAIGGINGITTLGWLLNIVALELRGVPGPNYGAPIYLKTGIENLYGWWWFNMDGGIWCYYFARNKTVRWYDINNHRSGQGKWAEKEGGVEVAWTSGTREQWPFEIVPSNQKGTSTSAGKTSTFTAVRVWDAAIAKIVGRWRMNCDKWMWNIDFKEDGAVKWSDYYNPSMNGNGTWHLTKNGVYLMWASGSRDEWTFSPAGGTATGRTTVDKKQYSFEATKTG